MYDVIDTKRGARKTYTEALIGRGDISMKEAEDALRDYQGQLERVFNEVRELEKHGVEPSESVEADQMIPAGLATAVDKSLLARIGDAHLAVPEGFTAHPRVKPVLERRREMAYEGKVDWAFGELLALGSLVAEGKLVRLSGQDTRRGTFTQRHSVIIDRNTGDEFTPLQLLATNKDGTPTGGKFLVYDSPLSEYAAVGFEYGYSVGNPDARGAVGGAVRRLRQRRAVDHRRVHQLRRGQVGPAVRRRAAAAARPRGPGPRPHLGPHRAVPAAVGRGFDDDRGAVDAGELLPPAAPARARRDDRPLIVFTPKSMLRNKAAVSDIRDFTEIKFRSVLEEPTYEDGVGDRSKVTRILLTSGKIYYELVARKAKDNRDDVAIVRIEQLAPLPKRRLRRDAGRATRTPTSSSGSRRSRPTRARGRRFGLDAARGAAGQVDRDQAHLAPGDVGAVVGFVEGARRRAAGDHSTRPSAEICQRDPLDLSVIPANLDGWGGLEKGCTVKFAGKVAVVTGAGSGIGQALAVELARSGASLADQRR